MTMTSWTASRDGLLFIARREGLVLVAYQDGPHMSIGFGSNDPLLTLQDTITPAEAFIRLKRDIAPREQYVASLLRMPIKQHQFDAMVSLHYQSGTRFVPAVAALVKANQFDVAAKTFPLFDFGIPGIHKRRLLEQNMFQFGDYGDLSTIPMWRGDPRKTPQETYTVQPEDLVE
jgi:lysozyme